ncbi:hypothetical protein [Spiroplasma platyhelix]|uniref:Lipoprotein n=1 Tax=Spiroplasma platyhelix PALS-1 TaxID=1276218 RepID=A0A846TPL2_9MOLU|nr:hypothetical protein [Spiroplasma platyhelix]MBE4703837.1 hypothetical protein [Spiroplasma platyhelix PALS-1]NKE38210.1 hypothetical protein [Spiroplasma platyhelix PALS-1]UJB29095.1 hypothetical protein SPLAT_v1c03310 [Spiroplasma platyhelix PALS-1]
MKTKLNFKKMLATLGLLAVAVPTSLSVVACGSGTTSVEESTEQKIAKAISEVSYSVDFSRGTKAQEIVNQVKELNFIKAGLTDEDVRNSFVDSLFKFEKITVEGNELNNDHLANPESVNAEINFSYGDITEKAKLIINFKMRAVTDEEFVEIAKERSETDPMKFTIKARKNASNYLPEVREKMAVQIYDEFSRIYGLEVDIKLLNLEGITSSEQDEPLFSYKWFQEVKTFNATGAVFYNGTSTGYINIIFNVVE